MGLSCTTVKLLLHVALFTPLLCNSTLWMIGECNDLWQCTVLSACCQMIWTSGPWLILFLLLRCFVLLLLFFFPPSVFFSVVLNSWFPTALLSSPEYAPPFQGYVNKLFWSMANFYFIFFCVWKKLIYCILGLGIWELKNYSVDCMT